MNTAGRRLAIPAIAVAGLALGFALFTSSGRDDAYITYGAAHSLAERGEIANINADRLEQSSTLLFTLVSALGSRLTTLSVPDVGIYLSILFGLLCVVLAPALAARLDRRLAIPLALLIATSPALLYWSFSGMEATLTALLMMWATRSAMDWFGEAAPRWTHLASMAVSFLLFTMVRPEAGIVLIAGTAGVGARVVLDSRKHDLATRRWGVMLATAVLCSGSLLLIRWLYFGGWVPQPVLAKASGLSLSNARSGVDYLWELRGTLWIIIPAFVGLGLFARDAVRRRGFPIATIPIAMLFAYLGFVVSTGGDWMELGRFVVPVVPLLALCALDAGRQVAWRSAIAATTALFLSLNVLGLYGAVRRESTGVPVWKWRRVDCSGDCAAAPWHERYNHIHNRDRRFLSAAREVMRSVVDLDPGRPVIVMSLQAGMVAYYLELEFGRAMRFVDTCSLVTSDFMACPVTQRAKKTSLGACTPIPELLQNRTALRNDCGIDPDIVFGLFPGTPPAIAALDRRLGPLGYQIAVAGNYPLSADGSLQKPLNINTGQYLAVRADIAARLPAFRSAPQGEPAGAESLR